MTIMISQWIYPVGCSKTELGELLSLATFLTGIFSLVSQEKVINFITSFLCVGGVFSFCVGVQAIADIDGWSFFLRLGSVWTSRLIMDPFALRGELWIRFIIDMAS